MQTICVPLELWIGATFILPVRIVDADGFPINVDGYAAKMEVRQTVNSTDPAIITASTANGFIGLDGENGIFQVILPDTYTSLLTPLCKAKWDFFIYSPQGIVTRIVGGTIDILESVTR